MKRILALVAAVLISVSISLGLELYMEPFLSSSRAYLDKITVIESMKVVHPIGGEDIPGFGMRDSTVRSAEIRYHVQGAEKLTVKFYAAMTAYAYYDGSHWIPGISSGNELVPVCLDPTGAQYIQVGDQWYQFQVGVIQAFMPVETPPESTVPLLLHVMWVDENGGRHSLSGVTAGPEPIGTASGFNEVRTYSIPKGAQELILSLNYPWNLRDSSGNPIPGFGINYPVVINEIRIEGTDLLFDQETVEPEEPSSPGDGDGSSSGSNSSGSGDGDSDDEIILPDNDNEDTWMDRTENPDSSEESSLMLSSSLAESSSEKSSSIGKTSSGGSRSDPDSSGEDDGADRGSSEPESETLIYQTNKETLRDKLFSAMLAGYGVIGLGAAWQIYLHTIRKK